MLTLALQRTEYTIVTPAQQGTNTQNVTNTQKRKGYVTATPQTSGNAIFL